MSPLAFRCPLCAEPFQVAAEHQGQAVACPHCQGAVAVPAPSPPVAAGNDPPELAALRRIASEGSRHPSREPPRTERRLADREPPPVRKAAAREQVDPAGAGPLLVEPRSWKTIQLAGEVYQVRSLTPEERAAFRRRVNLVVFGSTAAILALVLLVLLLWRG